MSGVGVCDVSAESRNTSLFAARGRRVVDTRWRSSVVIMVRVPGLDRLIESHPTLGRLVARQVWARVWSGRSSSRHAGAIIDDRWTMAVWASPDDVSELASLAGKPVRVAGWELRPTVVVVPVIARGRAGREAAANRAYQAVQAASGVGLGLAA